MEKEAEWLVDGSIERKWCQLNQIGNDYSIPWCDPLAKLFAEPFTHAGGCGIAPEVGDFGLTRN